MVMFREIVRISFQFVAAFDALFGLSGLFLGHLYFSLHHTHTQYYV